MSEGWVGGWDWAWVGQGAKEKTPRWWGGLGPGWAGEWSQYWGWRWWAGQTARQLAEKRIGSFIEGWGLGKNTADFVGGRVGQWTQDWVSTEQSLGAGWFVSSAASFASWSAPWMWTWVKGWTSQWLEDEIQSWNFWSKEEKKSGWREWSPWRWGWARISWRSQYYWAGRASIWVTTSCWGWSSSQIWGGKSQTSQLWVFQGWSSAYFGTEDAPTVSRY